MVVPAYDIFIWYHKETVSIQFLEIFKARKFGMGFFGVLLETLGIFWVLIFVSLPPHPLLPPSLPPLIIPVTCTSNGDNIYIVCLRCFGLHPA